MKPINNVIFMVTIFLFSCSNTIDGEKETGKAWNMIEKLEYEKAYNTLSKVLDKYPQNARALNYKGVAALNLGKVEEALEYHTASYKLDSTNCEINLNLGAYYSCIQDTSKALMYYKKAIVIDPNQPKAYSNIGVIATRYGQIDKALYYHNKALEIDNGFIGAYVNRAEAYLSKGDTLLALQDYNRALNIPSKELNAIYYTLVRRGVLFRSLKRYDNAIDDFTGCIKINDKDANAYYYRGMSYAGIANYEKALKDFKEAKELGRRNIDRLLEECERMIE